MRTLKIKKTFKTLDKVHNSDEFHVIYEGFQEKKQLKGDFYFLCAYVTDDDDIYLHYTCPDGLIVLKAVSVSSMLSNRPFELVKIVTDEIRFSGVYVDSKKRTELIELGITVY